MFPPPRSIRLDKASKDVFLLRNIRAGRSYTAFIHEDSLNAPHLDYLVYEQSISQYVVFGLADDSISVTKGEKKSMKYVARKRLPRSIPRSGRRS